MCRSRGSSVGSRVVGMQYAGYALLVGLSACTFNAERPGDVNGGGGGGGTTPHTGVGGTGVKIDAGDNRRRRLYRALPQPRVPAEHLHARLLHGAALQRRRKDHRQRTVYDPAGKVPLYNVVVYVPNAALDPVPEGASCDRCGATLSGKPIASAITDESGHFSLENVPIGADVPLVIQVGKWRRELTVPMVASLLGHADVRQEPDAASAQPERGAHPQDGAHHR